LKSINKPVLILLAGLLFQVASTHSTAANGRDDNSLDIRNVIHVGRSNQFFYDHGSRFRLEPKSDVDEKRKSNAISMPCIRSGEDMPNANTPVQKERSSIEAFTLPYVENWRTGVFGTRIGSGGIVAADVDLDGVTEIICGARVKAGVSDSFWYILEYSSTENTYVRRFISDPFTYPLAIYSLCSFDLDGNGTQEIILGMSDNRILIYDSVELREIGCIDSPTVWIEHIEFADGDNDSHKELIVCGRDNMFFYDPISLEMEHQIPYASSEFEIGNVDSDDANEIVLANGQVLEFDGEEVIEEWEYPWEFGYFVELSDIDSDGIQEIVAASLDNYITAYDAEHQSPLWQIFTLQGISAFLMYDFDGDGVEEVIYGQDQHGDIYCYNIVTNTTMRQIENPGHGITYIVVSDPDGDADLEIIWGSGSTASGEDNLNIYGVRTWGLEFQSHDTRGPFRALDIGDIDSDGRDEYVFASYNSNNGCGSGFIYVYDAITHTLEWQSEANMFQCLGSTGIQDLAIGDVDDDGRKEIVMVTDYRGQGVIYIIDGRTYALKHTYYYDRGSPMYQVEIADVDNDGETEIVAGCCKSYSDSPGVLVYIIDGKTGIVEWHSISLGPHGYIYSLEVGDIDGDDLPEIVAVNDNIFVIDGISHQQWQSGRNDFLGLDLYDIDNDGIKEIVAGTSIGDVIALDGRNYGEKLNINAEDFPIVGLRACDIGQNGEIDIVYGCEGWLKIFGIQSSATLWQSDRIASFVGKYNSIVVEQVQSASFPEILTGTDYTVVNFAVEKLSRISAVSPANESVQSSQPTFVWTADGGIDNVFAVDIALSLTGPFYSTWEHLGLPITTTEWAMTPDVWQRIPNGSYVFWRIRGADLDKEPLSIVYSNAIWFFYKP